MLDLADLMAAGPSELPTVADWVAAIDSTFTATTARTYRPYWNLAICVLGDHRLAELTVVDRAAVVRAAGDRARASHPSGGGRSAEESCVSALRAFCARAVSAGHLTADPASALAKPRRARGRRRALDDHEVAQLADAIRLTSRDQASTCCSFGSTSRPAPVAKAPSTCVTETSTLAAPPHGS